MSQYGAYGAALAGWNAAQILRYYYSGTDVTTAPSADVRVLLAVRRPGAPLAVASNVAWEAVTEVPVPGTPVALTPGVAYAATLGADGVTLTGPDGKPVGPFPLGVRLQPSAPVDSTAQIGVGTSTYRGAIRLLPVGGVLQFINVIGLEQYLGGVVTQEMPASWGDTAPAALQAQAIAARTYTLASLRPTQTFDLYDDTRSQVYNGVVGEDPRGLAAVAATAGQVVTYNGAPVVTYFSSSSGGHTENIEDAWPGASASPWLRGVDDPYDGAGGDPYHRWTRQLGVTAAAKQLGRLLKGKLVGIRVTQHGVSPRIMSAQVIGTKGSTTVTGAQLQSAFGLLSTWASFTTISGSAGQAPVTGAVHGANDLSVITQLKRAFALVGERTPVLRGRVVPARAGASVTFEMRAGKRWQRVRTSRLGKGGSYAVGVGRPGVYRTVYRGLDGPSVVVR
jgi:stage II sporulation protein D